MRPKLRDVPYPFDHARGRRMLAEVVAPPEIGRGDCNGALSVGVAACQSFESVYRWVMGRWASLLLRVEASIPRESQKGCPAAESPLGQAPDGRPNRSILGW
jgi:hypothetical protein